MQKWGPLWKWSTFFIMWPDLENVSSGDVELVLWRLRKHHCSVEGGILKSSVLPWNVNSESQRWDGCSLHLCSRTALVTCAGFLFRRLQVTCLICDLYWVNGSSFGVDQKVSVVVLTIHFFMLNPTSVRCCVALSAHLLDPLSLNHV